MDLFSPNIHLLDFQNYEANIKHVFENCIPNSEQLYIKHAILRNSEKVILLQTKYRSQFTDYDYFFINQISAYNSEMFLKIKSLMIDKDTLVHFCLEDGGMRLYDYMQKNEMDIFSRIILFKQACEIIREFKKFGELFLFFDWNIFYVIYDQLTKQPKLRAINNAGCFDIFRHFNKVLASKNEFSWLYYLYTLIFNDNDISSTNLGVSKVESEIRGNLKNTILGGMNGILRFSFDNFIDYFEILIKGWKPEDFNRPQIKPLQVDFLANAAPFLQLLNNNDFGGALKFLQGKNIFNQINNDCVNNKINVLFNVQNNTSIIDNSCNNINIINNIIQTKTAEDARKEIDKPVENEMKLRSKTIKIKDLEVAKINNKKIILSDSSSDESSELSNKDNVTPTENILNRKKAREDTNENLLNKKNELSDETRTRKKSKKEESLDSIYDDEIKASQCIQMNTTKRQSRLEDHELALISRIDNPKKKKNKNEILEKNQLKVDLKKYEIQYEDDLTTTLEDGKHGFMKVHFPSMYNLENYYLYIKNLTDKRVTKKHDIVVKIEHSNNICENVNKVWDARKIESIIVDEYLAEVEKVWPRDNYIWSEELALSFLMDNEYNPEIALKKIKNVNIEFNECLDKKQLHRDYHINNIDTSSIKQKRYK